jgi:hypothetical protein
MGMVSPSMSDMTTVYARGFNRSDIVVLGVQEVGGVGPHAITPMVCPPHPLPMHPPNLLYARDVGWLAWAIWPRDGWRIRGKWAAGPI